MWRYTCSKLRKSYTPPAARIRVLKPYTLLSLLYPWQKRIVIFLQFKNKTHNGRTQLRVYSWAASMEANNSICANSLFHFYLVKFQSIHIYIYLYIYMIYPFIHILLLKFSSTILLSADVIQNPWSTFLIFHSTTTL